MGEHDDLRIAVLVRNMAKKEFVLFEEEATKYADDDYEWVMNKSRNLEGKNKVTQVHHFTWQFHGAQFTVLRETLGSAIKFKINRTPPIIELEHVLRLAKFKDDWIEIIG